MAAKSTAFASALVAHVLGGPAYTPPTRIAVALLTAMPTTDGGAPTECAAAGYARATFDNVPAAWTFAGDGTATNAAAVQFPVPPGSWGVIVGWALYDDATGLLLYYAPLDNSLTISANESVSFPTGSMIVAER